MREDTSTSAERERRALVLSLVGAALMTCLASGFYAWTGSEAVLLDAVFNAITLVMAILTIRVSKLVQGQESARFQFGHNLFEAMLNTGKGAIIFVVCVASAFSAIQALVAGGRAMLVGPAVSYAVLATAICTALALVLHRLAERDASPLVALDALNWKMNALISGLVAVTFGLALLLEGTQLDFLVPFVDPALVLFLVVAIAKMPLDIIRKGLGELLLGAPEAELSQKCLASLRVELAAIEHEDVRIRMSKMGRLLYVLVHVLERAAEAPLSAQVRDRTRNQIERALRSLHPDVTVDVLFTREAWRLAP